MTKGINNESQYEFENVPTNYLEYKHVTSYRLAQVVGILSLLFIAFLLYPLAKDIYSWYRQLDIESAHVLIVLSVISFLCFAYFHLGLKMRRQQSQPFLEVAWRISLSALLSFLACTLLILWDYLDSYHYIFGVMGLSVVCLFSISFFPKRNAHKKSYSVGEKLSTSNILLSSILAFIVALVVTGTHYSGLLRNPVNRKAIALICLIVFPIFLYYSIASIRKMSRVISKNIQNSAISLIITYSVFASTPLLMINLDPPEESVYEADIIVAEFNNIIDLPVTFGLEAVQIPEVINVPDFICANLRRLIIEFGLDKGSAGFGGVRFAKSRKIFGNQKDVHSLLRSTSAVAVVWGSSLISSADSNYRIIYPMISYKNYHLRTPNETSQGPDAKDGEIRTSPREPRIEHEASGLELKTRKIIHDVSQLEPLVSAKRDFTEIETWLIYILLEVYRKKNGKEFFVNVNEPYLFDFLEATEKEIERKSELVSPIEALRQEIMAVRLHTYIDVVMDSSEIARRKIDLTKYSKMKEKNYDWNSNQAMKRFNQNRAILAEDPKAKLDWQIAIEGFGKALKASPNDFNALLYLGNSFAFNRQFRDAFQKYCKAFAISKNQKIRRKTAEDLVFNIKQVLDKLSLQDYKDLERNCGDMINELNLVKKDALTAK